ncbi:Nramp family divalent metal transporter [Lewinella sp. LCG006]|uniref:Nramp family divalent metal transporter n=1 Tax=Lewinella sp. LCG006 TaxID=3231911 RepID=UPI00345FE15C
MPQEHSILKKLLLFLLGIGPGIFAIGYTIGTGSVTSMVVAGSSYGMQLLWVLALSCLFSWVLMEAYGRYYLVTGETALFAFRKNLRFGNLIAILIIIGITFGQWNSLIGILGISANAIVETLALFLPSIKGNEYGWVLGIALIIMGTMYTLLWKGNYSIFEKILLFFVTLMGLSFFLSLFVILPDPAEVMKGFIPYIPQVEGGKMLVAAFVGTTMASATFISRPLFIQGKGWTKDNLKEQQKDALWAAILIFIISASIMSVAMGAFYYEGKVVTKVLDMVYALEPIAGRFAIAIFFMGTLAAGLSSVFPILMIAPLMIADYQQGKLDTTSKQFKIITGVACLIGLAVPVFGANPIKAQILTQVFNVFVLPLVIAGIIILTNRKALMGEHKAGIALNIGMVLALIFACIISYSGIMAILE